MTSHKLCWSHSSQRHHALYSSNGLDYQLHLVHDMAAQFPHIRSANGAHALCDYPLSNAPCSGEVEQRISAAELEKHAHGYLTDEASILARDGGETSPSHDSARCS